MDRCVLTSCVRRGFAAGCAPRLCRRVCAAALPPGVRRGFAAGCAPRLCRRVCGAGCAPPLTAPKTTGFALGMGSAPMFWAGGRTRGIALTLVKRFRRGVASPHTRRRSRCLPSRCLPSRCSPSRCSPSRCLPSRCLPSRCLPSRCYRVAARPVPLTAPLSNQPLTTPRFCAKVGR
jgi:hypothetical protein